MSKFDIKEVAQLALHHFDSLISDIAPGGKMIGQEYTAACVQGGAGTSFKINRRTGKWADFSTDEKGGDLVSLWAAAYNCDNFEAAKEIAKKVHYRFDAPTSKSLPAPAQKAVYQKEENKKPTYNLIPVPETAPQPTFFNVELGQASGYWLYQNEMGERLFWVARYNTKDGGKEFRPYSWDENRGIVQTGWPIPRPLYGLEQLAMNAKTPVMIVEGEKAAEAAKLLVKGKYIVMSWPFGSKAWDKVDWGPIYGRSVMIWPDNDLKVAKKQSECDKYGIGMGEILPMDAQPGMAAALGIANILVHHCPEVKYFYPHDIEMIKDVDGFDAANAVDMNWKWDDFYALVKPIVKKFVPPPVSTPIEENLKNVSTDFVQGSAFQICEAAKMSKGENGKTHATMSNVRKMLEYHPAWKNKIWFDNFHLKILTNWRTSSQVEWSDLDDLKVCEIFQYEFKLTTITPAIIRAGVQLYAHDHQKNEPREWILSNPWDGTERIREFFIRGFGTKDTIYTRQVSQNFMIALVARIMEPGIKFDHMVVLEGEQGKKKSSALEALGGKWFGEATEHIASKDFSMCLQGKMIIEIAELSAFSAAEVELVKKIITIKTDRFRPPYGHAMITYPRTSVFVGTTNRDDYLKDETGARRFWPIRIHNIDIDYIKENRSQLFAEALHHFRLGKEYWLMPEEETKREQEKRRDSDVYENIIEEWITTSMHDQVALSTDIIADKCIGITKDRLDKKMQNRIGKVMRVLGWEYKNHRAGMEVKKMWVKKDTLGYN